jgi:CxxC motif-containing protein (DUF1111 family)
MRRVKLIFLFALPLVLAAASARQRDEHQQQQQQPSQQQFTEAPAAFDNQPNDLNSSGAFTAGEVQFEQVEQKTPDGLGPVFNAQACRECHQNVGTGGSSQISELRAGHLDESGNFVGATLILGDGSTVGPRSLINQRAICADAQEYVPERENIRTLRTSLSIFGDGFVEAVPDDELKAISQRQADTTGGRIHGEWIPVPVLEAQTPGLTRVGRFGWKDQHASLLSFSGDAYINEMGVTNKFFKTEVTTLCNPDGISEPNSQPDPTTGLEDVDQFAAFMRLTKAPPRDQGLAASPDAQAGEELFERIGCATCHVESLYTAATGTHINGDTYALPPAIANKVFHPFGDFLLHDIGTGDGIVQNGGPETANKVRTAPLWGTRVRPQKMHDGKSLTFENAIERHRGEAANAAFRFRDLTEQQRAQLITFLKSL